MDIFTFLDLYEFKRVRRCFIYRQESLFPKSFEMYSNDLSACYPSQLSKDMFRVLLCSGINLGSKFFEREYLISLRNIHKGADTTFLQFPNSKVKLADFSFCSSCHALLATQENGVVSLLITLNGISVTKIDKQSIEITKEEQRVILKASSEHSRNTWVAKLQRLNSIRQIFVENTYKAEVIPTNKLTRRCRFSPLAKFSEAFSGGDLSDIIQFGVIHCTQPQADNILMYGLLAMVKEKDVFQEFAGESKRVFGKFSKKKYGKSARNWKNRITNFVHQVCRAYHLFSSSQRTNYIGACEEYVQDSEQIFAVAAIGESEFEPIEIRHMHVLPRWGEQTVNLQEKSYRFIAEQLTYFESQLHKQLDIVGLISNSGVAVNSIVSWWNQIASWTSSCILCEPNKKAQCFMYKIFVNIAEKLQELRNYSSMAQIVTGLRHHSVSRLQGLKDALHPKLLRRVEKLEEIISPTNNYSVYRNISKEVPCLRFLAVHQRDIRFICDGNPMFLDDERLIINAERLYLMGECVHALGISYPAYSYEYNLQRDNEFQDFLSQLKTVSDDDLFTLSFESEPNRGGEQTPLRKKIKNYTSSNPLHNSEKLQKLYKSEGSRASMDLDSLSFDSKESSFSGKIRVEKKKRNSLRLRKISLSRSNEGIKTVPCPIRKPGQKVSQKSCSMVDRIMIEEDVPTKPKRSFSEGNTNLARCKEMFKKYSFCK